MIKGTVLLCLVCLCCYHEFCLLSLDSLKYQVFYWAIYVETVALEFNSTKKLKVDFYWKATVTQTINQEYSVEIEKV